MDRNRDRLTTYGLWLLGAFLLFCLPEGRCFSQDIHSTNIFEFIPNQGQFGPNAIKYVLRGNNCRVLLTANGIDYQFLKNQLARKTNGYSRFQTPDSITIESIHSTFLQSNDRCKIEAYDQTDGFLNYYTTATPVLGVHGYKKVIYRGLYPKIDLVLTVEEGKIKSTYIVLPGGDPSQIQQQFSENTEIRSEDGSLLLQCATGFITEASPVSFQSTDKKRESQAIETAFKINRNVVSYTIGKYDRTKPLAIDPGRLWGTYYGGTGADRGIGIASDASNNVYVTGPTASNSNIATSGAYQTTIAGSNDAFLVKFNTSGIRQWATYFGGSADDQGLAIAVDGSGNPIIGGTTKSTTGIATTGAHQTVLGAAASGTKYDAFIAKFTSTGILSWSTYYGGDGDDMAYGMYANSSGDIFCTGSTASTNNIASSNSVYQSTFGGGQGDIFAVKFNSNGVRQWGTYYGGSAEEHCHSIAEDGNGNIDMAGYTASTSNIASSGAYQTTSGGAYDVILAQLNSTGTTRNWATYYGGTSDEGIEGLAVDHSNNIIIAGLTGSSSGIATSGAHQTAAGGSDDALIAKFTSSGGLVWATYYGGSGSDWAQAIALDQNDNYYVTGGTQSSTNIATSGAYQTSLASAASDAFCVKFNSSGARQWGTYYGGNGSEWGYGITVSSTGEAVITGSTFTSSNILASSGAVQTSAGGNEDAFVAKFCDITQPTISANGAQQFCQGGTITLTATGGYSSYQWQNGSTPLLGATQSTLTLPSTQSPGNYKITVLVSNSSGCTIPSDTIAVTINPTPQVSVGSDRNICSGSSTVLNGSISNGTPPYTYQWSPTASLSSTTTLTPFANPSATTVYTLTVTDSKGCSNQASVRISVVPTPTISAGADRVICLGDQVVLGDTARGGTPPYTYSWDPPLWLSSNSVAKPTATPLATQIYAVTATDANNCQATSSVRVTVRSSPTINLPSTVQTCQGTPVTIGSLASNGLAPYKYQWFPTTGLSTPDSAKTIANPGVTTIYHFTVTDANGCTVSSDIIVKVNQLPTPTITPKGTIALCDGDSVTIKATKGYSGYNWSTLATTDSIIVRKAGKYFVGVIDQSGCVGYSDTVTVISAPSPTLAVVGPPSVCLNESSTYSSSTPGIYTWQLSGGGALTVNGASATVTWNKIGTWQVHASVKNNSCSHDTTITVHVDSTLVPIVTVQGALVLCQGDSTVLTAPDGFTSYEWSSKETSKTIVIRSSGTYQVKMRAASGCEGVSAPITVTTIGDQKPIASLTPRDTTICDGTTITLRAAPGYASYTWSNGASGQTINVNTEGNYSYIAHTSGGCEGRSDTAHITVQPVPPISISGDSIITICQGSSTILTATTGFPKYRWSTGDTTQTLTIDSAGTYFVSGITASGCSRTSDSVIVRVAPKPVAVIHGPTHVCHNGTYTYTTDNDTQIQWQAAGGTVVNGQNSPTVRIQWTDLSQGQLTLIKSVSGDCEGRASITISISDSLQPIIMASSQAICDGDSVTLAAEEGYSFYRWSTGETTRSIIVRTTGSYYVHAGDEANCEGTSEPIAITASTHPQPKISTLAQSPICAGDSILLQSDGSYKSYQWYRDNSAIPNATQSSVFASIAGNYYFIAENAAGCTGASDTFRLDTKPLPAQPVITANGNILTSTPAVTYQWYFNTMLLQDSTNRSIVARDTGLYTVRITDSTGCSNISLPYHFTTPSRIAQVVLPERTYANTGDTVLLPLLLKDATGLSDGVHRYRTVIRFNKTLLAPLAPLPKGVEVVNDRVIEITDTSSLHSSGVLRELPFLAGLGNDSCTDVTIDLFEYQNENVSVLTESGVFCLGNLCYQGGTRLIDPNAKISLSQSFPNPTPGIAVIRFDLLESGATELYITNSIGEVVKQVLKEDLTAGSYSRNVNLRALPTGKYFYVLQTPSQRLIKTLDIVK